jgi:hypothetical protein
MKKKLIIFLLALHLLLIFVGTSLFNFSKIPVSLQAPVIYYLSLIGGHNYAFFSPDIPPQTIVRCEIKYKSGGSRTITFDRTSNTFALRADYVFQLLSSNSDYETAAQIAARDCINISPPRTQQVKVSIGTFIVPSVEEYKAGKRPTFSELYSEDFKP